MRKLIIILLCLSIVNVSCKDDKKEFSIVPQIYHLYTNPTHIDASNSDEFVSIQLRFTDGDQDLALNPEETDSAIYIKDSRDTSSLDYTYIYPMPFVPENFRDKNGLVGTLTINLNNAYFAPRDSLHFALKKDTVVWSVFIEDYAGHRSNVITSDTIYIAY